MITVKIFGTLRLDSGLKQMQADVKTAKELYPLIMDEVKRIDPNTKLTIKDVKGCILSRGGKQISPSTRLDDGDVICLVPAVGLCDRSEHLQRLRRLLEHLPDACDLARR